MKQLSSSQRVGNGWAGPDEYEIAGLQPYFDKNQAQIFKEPLI
jgi:hypothetical protein